MKSEERTLNNEQPTTADLRGGAVLHSSLFVVRSSFLLFAAASLALTSGCSALSNSLPGAETARGLAAAPPLPDGQPIKSVAADGDAAKLSLIVAADLEKSGHFREAALQLELARQKDAKLDVSRRLGRLYTLAGEAAPPKEQAPLYAKAIEEYGKALAAAKAPAELLNDLGYCHLRKGEAAKAEGCFRQALAKNPKLDRARINLGLALGAQGKFDEALVAFGEAVSPAEAHCNLAYVCLQQGDAGGAKQQYELALRKDPNLTLAKERLAALGAVVAAAKPVGREVAPATVAPPVPAAPPVVQADWRHSEKSPAPAISLGAPRGR